MNQTVTVSAKTLDEAISKGCAELGVDLTDVDFEVLDEGGMFRKMQVKITVKDDAAPVDEDFTVQVRSAVPLATPTMADNTTSATEDTAPAVEEFEIEGKAKPAKNVEKPRKMTEFDANCPKFTQTLAFAEAFFRLMGDNLTITTSHDDQEFVISVDGDDVSRLIGKSGRTMAAINTIISSIAVNTHSGEPRRVVVDIANYRAKRRESLINMAKNKAEYVKRTGKTVKLEPMPARERAIMHVALQDVEGVITQSEGVEPHRCLIIKPGAR